MYVCMYVSIHACMLCIMYVRMSTRVDTRLTYVYAQLLVVENELNSNVSPNDSIKDASKHTNNEIVSLFATPDDGLRVQDKFPITGILPHVCLLTYLLTCLLTCLLPHLCFESLTT